MERSDLLKREDQVTVTVYGPDGSRLYQETKSGFHTIEGAIEDAVSNANLNINPEECVFEISNPERGVNHRYRLNAHGNVKLIV